MSTTLRLFLVGKRNYPIYRIVAATTRSKRNGKVIEILGTYNPNLNPPSLNLDKEKLRGWVKNGAIISTGLRKILS